MDFSSFSFDARIMAGIAKAGYTTPTPIQEQAMPPVLAGRDLLGLAQTGTGKTAAFALPILQRLLAGDRCAQRVLILSPTRELAEQTHMAIQALAEETGMRSMTIYGGVTAKSQVKTLRSQLPEIIVACPGRLLDLMGQGFVDLKKIEILVLDEADQMFDMGFLPSIRRIVQALPAKRQTLLFSATMPSEIRALAREFQRDPVKTEISVSKPIETVSHYVYPVSQGDKLEMLKLLLPQTGSGQTLIFTRTKHRAKKLALQLNGQGHAATSLQGNLSQGQREKAMDSFRSGKAQVMVATDIAARGIDISKISHVINFDIPDTAEAYTHRIGRTGRMHREGTAFTFVTPEDHVMLKTIEKAVGSSIERRTVDGFVPGMAAAAGTATFDAREPREQRPARSQKQARDAKPARDARPARDTKPVRDMKPARDAKPTRDARPAARIERPRSDQQRPTRAPVQRPRAESRFGGENRTTRRIDLDAVTGRSSGPARNSSGNQKRFG